MHKFQMFVLVLLLTSCSSHNKKAPIKLVNHSIPSEGSNITFSIDSDYCSHKVLRDRPYVYKECKYYTNPAMRKNCLNENIIGLSSFKKVTQKLYMQCLEERGWQEDVPTKNINGSIEIIDREAPIYPVEAISLCIEGKVKVGFTISKDGTAKDVTILDAKPEGIFDAVAINAVSKWRFKRIMVNGELMEQYVVQELMFKPYEGCGKENEIPSQ